ncbi:MAG: hypothetical protein MI784_04925 [Cytophagales bacterium]|nr:hypothetical protein [Cytophagales bacterium]
MTDLEFDILDELYFVESYSFLKEKLSMEDEPLCRALIELVDKGWVKAMVSPEKETVCTEESEFSQCWFLATKDGLMKHKLG